MMMDERLLRKCISDLLREAVPAGGGPGDFIEELKAEITKKAPGAVFKRHTAKMAKDRQHSPPGTDSAYVLNIQSGGLAKKAAIDLLTNFKSPSGNETASFKDLGVGIYRKHYSTYEITDKTGSTSYWIVDDGQWEDVEPGKANILTDKILGKAAEYAIAAALNSGLESSPGNLVDISNEMYEKFLSEVKPEGKNVSNAPPEAQEEFKRAFDDLANGAMDGMMNAQMTLNGAEVASGQSAIADIDTNTADIHVKLNSTRLGGVHRIAEIPTPMGSPVEFVDADDDVGGEIDKGRSTDIYEKVFDELIQTHKAPGSNLQKQRHFIRDKKRKEAVETLESRGYLGQLEKDISDILETGASKGKETYYFSFKKTPKSAFMGVKIEKIDTSAAGELKAVRNKPGEGGIPSTTHLYKLVNAEKIGDAAPETLDLITIEFRGDRKPQMHRGEDFSAMSSTLTPEAKIRSLVRSMLLQESRLDEAFTASDEKAIGVIARKEAQKLWDDKWEKKILDIVKKELKDVYKGKEFTDAVVKIHKKAQLAYLRLQWEKGRQFTRYDISPS
jgi:hypothetical protein